MISTEDLSPCNDRLVLDMDRVIITLERNSPNTNRTRSPSFGEDNDYGDHLYYQYTQYLNEDDDSGMSVSCWYAYERTQNETKTRK